MKKILLLITSCFMLSCEETTVSPSAPTGSDADVLVLMYVQNSYFSNAITTVIQPTIILKGAPSTAYYPSVDAGAVSVNNIVLSKEDMGSGNYTYQDSTNQINSIPMNWNITGSSSFPAVSFIDSGNGMPTFSNYSQLPDTINRANGFTFTFSNLVNYNATVFKIYPGSSVEVSANVINGVVNLSPAQLSSLPTANFGSITIECIRTSPFDISANGKIFRYTYKSTYTKYGVVVQ